MTQATRQLKQGERVRIVRPIAGMLVGTPGVVLRRLMFEPLYDVCFDGHIAPRFVNKRDVAPARLEVPTA